MRHAVEAAKDWGRPPTFMLGVSEDAARWSATDRDLAAALAAYERLLCPCGCGFLRDVSMGDSEGYIEAVPLVCHAREARERWEQKQKSIDPGTIVALRDVRTG